MSKSLGNVVAPQSVIKDAGADILRLWVAASDYSDDLRIGPEILKTFVETYRKLRNTIRWMLGSLAHYDAADPTRLAGDGRARKAHATSSRRNWMARSAMPTAAFDYKRVVARLSAFLNTDLSAFYFDIRKDTLYCEPPSSEKRRAALDAIEQIFRCVTCVARADSCFHLGGGLAYPATPKPSRCISKDFRTCRRPGATMRLRKNGRRSAVSARLSPAPWRSSGRRSGSVLRSKPRQPCLLSMPACGDILDSVDFAEICITSDIAIEAGEGPADAFRLDDIQGVAVRTSARAEGKKCARSWRISPLVGSRS